jgi:hypothetical protein
MNIKGRDVLLGAFVDGIKQLRGRAIDGCGGFCSIGLLLYSIGCPHLSLSEQQLTKPSCLKAHKKCMQRLQEEYDISYDEWQAILRENNTLGLDFLTIAWLHCPPTQKSNEPSGTNEELG